MRKNRVLADRHRVVLGEWPIISAFGANDPRAATLAALFEHCAKAGYDGIEIGPSMTEFVPWFPKGTPHAERVRAVRALAARTSVPIVGATYCVGGRGAIEDPTKGYHNLEFDEPGFLEVLRARIRSDKEYGVEYASFQLHLPPEHCETGGMYRNDAAFLALSARRIADIQRVCFEEGVNFYVETHIFKISEDIQAFTEVMKQAPFFEVNGDLSHYIYRGIWKGPELEAVLARVGHLHERMARQYGDLSSDHSKGSWEADWADPDGASRSAWRMTELALTLNKGLGGGLSSRCVMGETGEMGLVAGDRCLDLDASLLPLYRKMAAFADRAAGVA
jgi:sugar phosphate isomerase/epimerase